MSLILEGTLASLVPFDVSRNATVTIFCPPDKAFFSSKYPQPPFTLLQYHVVPLKIGKEDLESSLPLESKIDTLLPGHPLVVTSRPHKGPASINDVKVMEWDIYNNGHVFVHGVEDFFDPAFQTLLYPRYDTSSNSNSYKNDNSGMDTKSSFDAVSVFSRVKDIVMEYKFVLVAALAFVGMCVSVACFRWRNSDDGGYVYIGSDVGALV